MTDLLGLVDSATGVVHLQRRLAAPVERVWSALTDPARLGDWLAPVESGAPGLDGRFVLRMNAADETATCTVIAWDPPHEMRLTWDYTGEPASELTLRLAADGAGTLLRLEHTRITVDVVQYGAGWHVHLDNLDVHLAGGDVRSEGCAGPAFMAAWEALAPRYAATDPGVSTVALVTGAGRGIGRGVALALADTGATVHVTDRESRARRHSTLPGTVEDTAEQVDARGGHGVPHVVDHAAGPSVLDPVVAAIADAHGGLDLVVANAFAGNALPFAPAPFWDLDPAHWANMIDVGLWSHDDTARATAPLVIARRGLVVLTGYASGSADEVLGRHAVYDLAMTGIARLAHSLHADLAPLGATALCLSPGFTATEAIVAALGSRPLPPGVDDVEAPGRAVCALLVDPEVARHGGRTVPVGA